MTTDDTRRLQARLGVRPDAVMGRDTWRALFARLGAAHTRAQELALGANVHVPRYEIDASPRRLAHFLAQVCHESGGFQYMEEIASGSAYEGDYTFCKHGTALPDLHQKCASRIGS